MTPMALALMNRMPGPAAIAQLRRAVVERLSMDQATRETVLADLNDLREAFDQQGDDDHEEVVLTVMDHLVGFCSPFLSLIGIGRSENDEDSDDIPFDDAE